MVNGVGPNGNGPEKVNIIKQVAQENAKGALVGGLKNAIGNLLSGGNKTDTIDQPIKGLGIEHTTTVPVNITQEYYENGRQVGMADYTASGTVGYTASGTVDYPYTGTVAYDNGGVSGMVDYSGVGTADYTASGTVDYGHNVEYSGTADYTVSGAVDYSASETIDHAEPEK